MHELAGGHGDALRRVFSALADRRRRGISQSETPTRFNTLTALSQRISRAFGFGMVV